MSKRPRRHVSKRDTIERAADAVSRVTTGPFLLFLVNDRGSTDEQPLIIHGLHRSQIVALAADLLEIALDVGFGADCAACASEKAGTEAALNALTIALSPNHSEGRH